MVGLTFLKYMFGLSDREALAGWRENPYWQYFCGGEFFEREPPTDQTVTGRWRRRAGEAGATDMIAETLASAVRSKVAKDFERVNVDTTVQEKNVRFPTDARTLDRARERGVAEGTELGIPFRRNYRTTPGKDRIYSVHEPQVECIAKGKVHRRYEFGVKAGLVTASRTNWILGAMALPGNPYDGHTLARMFRQAEEITGVKPRHAYCDLGYRGHDCGGGCDVQVVDRSRRHRPRSVLRWRKRRSAIEPVIGHVKGDHRMGRNMRRAPRATNSTRCSRRSGSTW